MKAETLKGFFEGRVRGHDLAAESEKAEHDARLATDDVLTDDLTADFVVKKEHLAMLCDAVARNDLRPCNLETIASVLVRSERFLWDPTTGEGSLVSKVIYAWEAPEINYVLSADTVKKFALLLRRGEDTFSDADWSEVPRTRR